MAGKSPLRGLHPVYRVYLVGFAMFVGAVASFAAGVKVLGFVFFALMLVCGGITTVMLLTLARRRKADLRATPRADDYALTPGALAALAARDSLKQWRNVHSGHHRLDQRELAGVVRLPQRLVKLACRGDAAGHADPTRAERGSR